MANCSACRAEIDATSLAQGSCRKCGGTLSPVPQRKVQDIRDTLLQELTTPKPDKLPRVELDTVDPLALEETHPNINSDTAQTLELGDTKPPAGDDSTPAKPATVVLANEQTIDFNTDNFDTTELAAKALKA